MPTPLNSERQDVLNAQSLADLALLDPTGVNLLVPRVLRTYLASLTRLSLQLRTGLASGDAPMLRLAAHTLKSSSASVGALVLSGWCAQVELVLREDRPDDLPELIGALLAETVQVEAAVKQLLAD